MIVTFLVGLVAAVLMFGASGFHPTPYNNYVVLADALRHGHVWIDWPGPRVDALQYKGKFYIIEGPLPAILALPFVAILGLRFNQEILGALLGGVAAAAAWELCRRLGTPLFARLCVVGFFVFGTDLFWCATFGDVWFVAHLAGAAFTLLALVELAGKRRGWLVALYAACAFESRFSLLLAVPVYAALLWHDRTPRERLRSLAGFGAVLLPFAAGWIAYNFARWNVPYDVGYAEWYHRDDVGEPTGSPFRLQYVPYELWSFFVQWPLRYKGWPYLIPTLSGVALTWTSPALILAFFARRPPRLVLAMWAAAILTAIPDFTYYVNGTSQFGMRHALDFEPFLLVLMALAVRNGIGALGSLLCSWSITAGMWGVWFWRTFYRPGFPSGP